MLEEIQAGKVPTQKLARSMMLSKDPAVISKAKEAAASRDWGFYLTDWGPDARGTREDQSAYRTRPSCLSRRTG
jgi:hypothetical protein